MSTEPEWWSVEDAVADLMRFAEDDAQRIPTGYSVDNTCGMIGPGELGLIWGRSGSGKSTFYLNTIANSPSVPTLVFNMEMTARKQLEWLAAMSFDLRTPCRDITEVLKWGTHDDRYEETVKALHDIPKVFPHLTLKSPKSAPTARDIGEAITAVGEGTGTYPQRVIIDHLTLMKGAQDYEGIARTTSQLHLLAMEAEVAIVVVQQTGRSGGEGIRNDGHLPVRLSSGLYAGEHDADFIWGLYRPELDPFFEKKPWEFRGKDAEEQYEKMLLRKQDVAGITKLQLIKNRPYSDLNLEGVSLRFDKHTYRLNEWSNQ